jgi:TonB-linked SusC/RagA family outer membrane protein
MKKNLTACKVAGKVLSAVILTVFLLCMPMGSFLNAQQGAQPTISTKKITVEFTNEPIKKALERVELLSEFRLAYPSDLIANAGNVTIPKADRTVEATLELILKGTDIGFKQEGRSIVLFKTRPASTSAQAQKRINVRGVVRDESNVPLPDAVIMLKGTHRSVVTNTEGIFNINDVAPNATLVVMYISYKTLEYNINGLNYVEMTMEPDTRVLGDIMVTGYRSISKERTAASFDVITREQLEKPAINIGSRIIGAAAGVVASMDSDGNPTFQIRGQSSLYANTQPLVVVDGFPVEGGFASVNPNDVEVVSILKDAAAASIWGARSANGVIVITTKKAKSGEGLKVEFNSFVRAGSKLDLDYVNPLASSAETVEYEKAAFNKWGARFNSTNDFRSYYGAALSQAGIALNEEYLGHISAQQRDAILEQLKTQDNRSQIRDNILAVPLNQQYHLTLSSASERSSNRFSLLLTDNQSNFKKTGSKEYMFNYQNISNVFKWLDFEFSGMFQYRDYNNSGLTLNEISELSPYDMLFNNDGSLARINYGFYWPLMEQNVPMSKFPYADWTYNPIREADGRDLRTKNLNTRIQTALTVKLIQGLSFKSSLQYEYFNTFNRNYYGEDTYYVRNTVNRAASWNLGSTVTPNLPKGAILNQSRSQLNGYNFRNQINFNRVFGQHDVNIQAGSELISNVSQSFNYPTTYGYNDNTLTVGTFPNGPGGTFKQIQNWLGTNQTFSYTNSFSYSTDRYFSLYAVGSYTFNEKYTLDGSIRTDASNLISDDPAYRYAPRWHVGAAWNIYKEDFMKPVTWVDRLTIRGSYGLTGNVDKSTAFMPLISMGTTPNTYTQDFTASISSYGNPVLRWEKTYNINIGADYSLLGHKLFGKIDLYNKKGVDQIATISIPAINGTNSQKLNSAEILNRGIELEVGSSLNIKGREITWSGNLNMAYNYNKVTKLFKATYASYDLYGGGTAAYVEGTNAQSLWVFRYAGIYNLGTESTPNWQPMVWGPDENTRYDFTGWTPGDARTYMVNAGTKVAPFNIALTNQFKIHNFDISFIITGKFGHKFMHQSFDYPVMWSARVLPNKRVSEVMNGDPMKIVPLPLNDGEPRFYFWDRFYPYLDYLVDNAGHIRMQEINLTYNVPLRWVNQTGLNRIQVYAQSNNLFVITFNKYHEDPEYPLGNTRLQPKFTFGLKLNF